MGDVGRIHLELIVVMYTPVGMGAFTHFCPLLEMERMIDSQKSKTGPFLSMRGRSGLSCTISTYGMNVAPSAPSTWSQYSV